MIPLSPPLPRSSTDEPLPAHSTRTDPSPETTTEVTASITEMSVEGSVDQQSSVQQPHLQQPQLPQQQQQQQQLQQPPLHLSLEVPLQATQSDLLVHGTKPVFKIEEGEEESFVMWVRWVNDVLYILNIKLLISSMIRLSLTPADSAQRSIGLRIARVCLKWGDDVVDESLHVAKFIHVEKPQHGCRFVKNRIWERRARRVVISICWYNCKSKTHLQCQSPTEIPSEKSRYHRRLVLSLDGSAGPRSVSVPITGEKAFFQDQN